MKKIDINGNLINLSNDIIKISNRQSLEKLFIPNGAIYCSKIEFYNKNQSFYGNHTIPYIMDDISSIDIDTKEDFLIAELLVNNKH